MTRTALVERAGGCTFHVVVAGQAVDDETVLPLPRGDKKARIFAEILVVMDELALIECIKTGSI